MRLGEIITNATSNRVPISKINKELKKLSTIKTEQPNWTWGTELNQEFTAKESQRPAKHLKKCPKSLEIRSMQLKTTLRFHLPPNRMAKIKTSDDNTCWVGHRERGTLPHYWWDFKLIQPPWKSIWSFLWKLEIYLREDPSIPFLEIYPEVGQQAHVHYVHSGLICVEQKMSQISQNRRRNTENLVLLCNGILELSY